MNKQSKSSISYTCIGNEILIDFQIIIKLKEKTDKYKWIDKKQTWVSKKFINSVWQGQKDMSFTVEVPLVYWSNQNSSIFRGLLRIYNSTMTKKILYFGLDTLPSIIRAQYFLGPMESISSNW